MTTRKKVTTKKTPAKRAATKRVTTKPKAATKKALAKKAATKKVTAKKAPTKKVAAKAKPATTKAEAPKAPKLIEYEPAEEFVPPREGTKGERIINALRRKNGATLIELADIIRQCNEYGIGGKSPETEQYARSWLPSSYLREQYGVGLRSEHCKQGGRVTLRVFAIVPEKVRERKVRRAARKPAAEQTVRTRRPKAPSLTSAPPVKSA